MEVYCKHNVNAPFCGDGECNGEEPKELYCPEDCGSICGDGWCQIEEHCGTCYQDCPCDDNEHCDPSVDVTYRAGCVDDPEPEPFCGDGECDEDEMCGECEDCNCLYYGMVCKPTHVHADRNGCLHPGLLLMPVYYDDPRCGNGKCQLYETCLTCPEDCSCEEMDKGYCEFNHPDADMYGCVLPEDFIDVPENNYRLSMSIKADGEKFYEEGEESKLYANGISKRLITFKAEKKVDTVEGPTWVPAENVKVTFRLQRLRGGSYFSPLGSLSNEEITTDKDGDAFVIYTAPFDGPYGGSIASTGHMDIEVVASAKDGKKNIGNPRSYMSIYPPIRIEPVEVSAKDRLVDENGKGLIKVRIIDPLDRSKTVHFRLGPPVDELSFFPEGPFDYDMVYEAYKGDDFDIYIQPVEGERSIDLDDIATHAEIWDKIGEGVWRDTKIIARGIILRNLPIIGDILQRIQECGPIGKAVGTPSNYVWGKIALETSMEMGEKMGETSDIGERMFYAVPIITNGVWYSVGLISWDLPGGEIANFGFSVTTNTLNEYVLASVQPYLINTAQEKYYFRQVYLDVVDEDGYHLRTQTYYFVRRYE
ncbi:hypothetical protein JXC34_01105 [Candidatus Woesearchaeota archaeon]|nr:hypothetical protein [Candidatus Woesearchaeota archaeon]